MITERVKDKSNNVIKYQIPEVLNIQKNLEQARTSIYSDGLIIGTGESDFTKGNVEYFFTHTEGEFVLIDVPGIEGVESDYELMVEKAVAKAHMIFYVNGTNKKPEAKTAERIKKYLRRDASVLAICNIRGKADTYEFEEDRDSLMKTHKSINEVVDQTQDVLNSIIGTENVVGVEHVQGLLGFCSIAVLDSGYSTISKNRKHDLSKAQKGYLKNFGEIDSMRKFSRIDVLESKIMTKLETYKSDIVESNKRKILKLLEETLAMITDSLEKQNELSKLVSSEINRSISEVNKYNESFSSSFERNRNNALNALFSNIIEDTYDNIEVNFGDEKKIQNRLENFVKAETDQFTKSIKKINEDSINELSNKIKQVLTRLEENVFRISFQVEASHSSFKDVSINKKINETNFNFSDFAIFFKNIANYIITLAPIGAGIGSGIPVIGNLVGGIIGGVAGLIVGLIVSIFNLFGGKEKKIRTAQSNISKSIEEQKQEFKKEFEHSTKQIIKSVNENIFTTIIKELKEEIIRMEEANNIIHSQKESITILIKSMKEKPYGTI